MKIYIVIPTYNEKENIQKLIPQIFQQDIPHLHILVVDDSSPDGTAESVLELKKIYPRLDLLKRPRKMGLGNAYKQGFLESLERQADLVFAMDADFSHDPKYISRFITAAKNYDLVLGSRYIAGGGIKNWNIIRRLVSYFGNLYARTVLGLPFKDLTGGFKCYRREALEKIIHDKVSSIGYNFQIETTYRAFLHGFTITEIPIIFTERQIGKSKFNFKIILESFWKVIALRFKKF